jgi:transposase InsO family protein
MSEQTNHSPRALFRFAVVSQVLIRIRTGERLAETVRAVAAGEHVFFDGTARRISPRTIYRWLAAYRARGMAGLEPRRRGGRVSSNRLPSRFLDFLIREKQRDRPASIPELIRRAVERGILRGDHDVDRTTVYRTATRLGVPLARGRRVKDRDTRRFAFAHRMDMVLCDGKHFRAGARRQKRVALFYLDDATRHVLHVVVGTSETAPLFQRGLYECIARHGYMAALYLDRGPGFVAEDTIRVMANLGIPLIHGEAGYKQGRGKVERFNRTIKADVLRGLDGRPDVDPQCGALELRLAHYADKVYAHRPHESLGGRSPWQRFSTDPKPLRWPEDRDQLKSMFEIWMERRVSHDHVVSIDSIDYEMPRGYAGQKVTLRRRLLEGTIGFLHEGQLILLSPVDPAANARAARARDKGHNEPQAMPPTTAAEISFQRDFGPIVDRDGGFDDSEPDDHDPEEIHP